MMFWTREFVGWLCIALGLMMFGACYFVLIRNGKIFEAGPAALIGIIMFRGGIHLLKVAVAARLCQQPEPKAARTVVPSSRLR
jgi:hypothetical protein